jgi:hypothetical protein
MPQVSLGEQVLQFGFDGSLHHRRLAAAHRQSVQD